MKNFLSFVQNLLRDFICGAIGFLIILLLNQGFLYVGLEFETAFDIIILSLCYIAAFMISIRLRKFYENGSLYKDLVRSVSKEEMIEKQRKLIQFLKDKN